MIQYKHTCYVRTHVCTHVNVPTCVPAQYRKVQYNVQQRVSTHTLNTVIYFTYAFTSMHTMHRTYIMMYYAYVSTYYDSLPSKCL